MPDVPITVACGDYDRVRALREGTVGIAGCAVTYATVEANALFIRNLKSQEFDVSEMSFSTYITLKAQRAHHYTAVPVFLSRAFRHSAIFVRTDRIASPADLKGKRVGTPEYLTTMLVWMRGLLSDEYGIAPSDLRWRLGGMEQPSAKTAPPEPVAGVEIHFRDRGPGIWPGPPWNSRSPDWRPRGSGLGRPSRPRRPGSESSRGIESGWSKCPRR